MRFLRCASQEFAGFTVIADCFVSYTIQISEYVDITFLPVKGNLSRGNFSRYVALIKPRFHRSSGVFLYVRNFLHFCIYLFSIFIYLSICFKIA